MPILIVDDARLGELHAKQMPLRVDAVQTRICLPGIGKASHQAPNFWWLSPEFQSPGGGLGLGCSNGFSAFVGNDSGEFPFPRSGGPGEGKRSDRYGVDYSSTHLHV